MLVDRPKVLKRGRKKRKGRGFSRNELKQAGSNPAEALKLHIPFDAKRRTAHEENTEALRKILEPRRTAKKSKGKPKS